jgi:hypothetical protein
MGVVFPLFSLAVPAFVVSRYLIERQRALAFRLSPLRASRGRSVLGEHRSARTHLRAMRQASSVVRETAEDEAWHLRADE